MTAPATNFLDPTGVALLADTLPGSPSAFFFSLHSLRASSPDVLVLDLTKRKVNLAARVPSVAFKMPDPPMVRLTLKTFPPQYKTLDYTPVEYGQIFPPPASEKTI